jgi:hypothetical protein
MNAATRLKFITFSPELDLYSYTTSFRIDITKGAALRLIASAVTIVLLTCVPAPAAWKEYPHPELGFVVQFPADPGSSTGNYKTILVSSAPVHMYTVKEDHASYVATVVDLLDRKEEGASLLNEAEFNLSMLGDITGFSTSRVEPGKAAIFGRFMTIECRSTRVPDQPGQTEAARTWLKNMAGLECPDHARLTVNLFFHRGRLYLIQGLNLPTPDDPSFGPSALRFANSVSFYNADGSRDPADEVQ